MNGKRYLSNASIVCLNQNPHLKFYVWDLNYSNDLTAILLKHCENILSKF